MRLVDICNDFLDGKIDNVDLALREYTLERHGTINDETLAKTKRSYWVTCSKLRKERGIERVSEYNTETLMYLPRKDWEKFVKITRKKGTNASAEIRRYIRKCVDGACTFEGYKKRIKADRKAVVIGVNDYYWAEFKKICKRQGFSRTTALINFIRNYNKKNRMILEG